MTNIYRPVPGKLAVEMVQNRVVTVKAYGEDASGAYVEVQLAGSYGARMRIAPSCIRRLTEAEHAEVGATAPGTWR
jgi:hypothetical protein